jgi:hypothetical protein
MLRPTKHTNPRLAILYGSGQMLRELRQKRIVSFEDLHAKVLKQLGPDAVPDFPMYAAFLYLIGKVDYSEKTDSFVYLEGPK